MVFRHSDRKQTKAVGESVWVARGEERMETSWGGGGNIPDLGLLVCCGQNLWSKTEKTQAHPAPSLLGPSVGILLFIHQSRCLEWSR